MWSGEPLGGLIYRVEGRKLGLGPASETGHLRGATVVTATSKVWTDLFKLRFLASLASLRFDLGCPVNLSSPDRFDTIEDGGPGESGEGVGHCLGRIAQR